MRALLDKAAAVRVSTLNTQVREALNAYTSASPPQKEATFQTLEKLTRQRGNYLDAILTGHAAAVIASSLDGASLRGFPDSLNGLLEHKITLNGTLEHYHVDHFSPDTSPSLQLIEHIYYLQPRQGQRIPVYFPNDGPKDKAGPNFTINGIQLGGKVAVESYFSPPTGAVTYSVEPDMTVRSAQPVPPLPSRTAEPAAGIRPLSAPASQKHKIAVILYNFRDFNSQPITPAQARDMVFTGTGNDFPIGSVNAFFQESTYGKIQFTGTLRDDGDVFGWYTLDHTAFHTDGSFWIYDDAFVPLIQALAQPDGFNIANYDAVVYLANYDDGTGSWHGNKIVFASGGRRTYWPLIAHELGHALGLGHAHSLNCLDPASRSVPVSDNCSYTEYGNLFDIMAAMVGFGHHNAWEKLTLGVLDSANVVSVTSSGVYHLNPLETPVTGTQALKIHVGPLHFANGYDMLYWIEFRANTGWDRGFPSTPWDGGQAQTYPAPNGGVLVDFAPDPGKAWGPFAVLTNIPPLAPPPPDNIVYHPLPYSDRLYDPDAKIAIYRLSQTSQGANVYVALDDAPVLSAASIATLKWPSW
ncbi:MAG: hypothetical protein JOY71_21720 [Acetobacteraceae bacterium]|nr:hypothetical protein [Acetobacteraceae bacterium]